MDKGHGRMERRAIDVRSDLVGYLKFPYVGTTFRLDRQVSNLDGSAVTDERVYGITSRVARSEEGALALLGFARGHWSVEALHYVRDVTFDEDRSQVRTGNGPRVMATLRNLAISVLRLAGATSVAKAVRWCSRHVEACLRLIGLCRP